MTNYPYPVDVLPPRKVVPDIVPATTGGGRGITAVEQILSYDAGYWQIDLQEIPLASRQQKLAWRAMSANLDGRLGIADVPIYMGNMSPWPITSDGQFLTPFYAKFSDLTNFSDNTDFSDAAITASVVNDAALGATTMVIFVETGASELQAGMDFSVLGSDLWRLIRIKRVVSETAMDGGVQYAITITPPLREAISAGTDANFEQPLCSCRLLDDLQMRSGADDYAGRTLANLSFVEALAV